MTGWKRMGKRERPLGQVKSKLLSKKQGTFLYKIAAS